MGPHIALNFFMTRLLFVEKNKVNSLKAKSDKAQIQIVVDNAKILREKDAKSLPPVPAPPSAPESPKPVEGRKGVRWLGLLGKEADPAVVYSGAVPTDEHDQTRPIPQQPQKQDSLPSLANLKIEDDDTEITEASISQAFDAKPVEQQQSKSKPVKEIPAFQSFPSNRTRGGGMLKGAGSIGRKLGRPSIKKRGSSKSAGAQENGNGSSSGGED